MEGGFAFGIGMYMQEEMIYGHDHDRLNLFANNAARYKVPTHDDMPLEWNVRILGYGDDESPQESAGIYGTKGIGEANVQLALSTYFALKDVPRGGPRRSKFLSSSTRWRMARRAASTSSGRPDIVCARRGVTSV